MFVGFLMVVVSLTDFLVCSSIVLPNFHLVACVCLIVH